MESRNDIENLLTAVNAEAPKEDVEILKENVETQNDIETLSAINTLKNKKGFPVWFKTLSTVILSVNVYFLLILCIGLFNTILEKGISKLWFIILFLLISSVCCIVCAVGLFVRKMRLISAISGLVATISSFGTFFVDDYIKRKSFIYYIKRKSFIDSIKAMFFFTCHLECFYCKKVVLTNYISILALVPAAVLFSKWRK